MLVKCGIIVVWPGREWYCGFEKSGPRGPGCYSTSIYNLNVECCWLLVHSFSLPAQFVCTWRVATWPSLDPLSGSGNYWVLMQGRGWGNTMWNRGPQFWHEYKVGLLLFPAVSLLSRNRDLNKLSACLVSKHPFKLLLPRFLEYEKELWVALNNIVYSSQYCRQNWSP